MKKSTKTKWVLYFCFLISIWLIAFMAETVVRWNSALVVQVYRCYEGLFGLAPFASQILYLTMKGVVLGGTVALIVLFALKLHWNYRLNRAWIVFGMLSNTILTVAAVILGQLNVIDLEGPYVFSRFLVYGIYYTPPFYISIAVIFLILSICFRPQRLKNDIQCGGG